MGLGTELGRFGGWVEKYFGKSHLGVTVLEEVVQVDGVSYVVLIYDRMGRPETWLDGGG